MTGSEDIYALAAELEGGGQPWGKPDADIAADVRKAMTSAYDDRHLARHLARFITPDAKTVPQGAAGLPAPASGGGMPSMRHMIRALADGYLRQHPGAVHEEVRRAVQARTGWTIGYGGAGPYSDWPECRCCGAKGGGGHGGLCPGGDVQ